MTGHDGDAQYTSEALCFALVHATNSHGLHIKKSGASEEIQNETGCREMLSLHARDSHTGIHATRSGESRLQRFT